MSDNKKITVVTLAFMAFSTVWGFGNVLNGFIYFNGIQVILSWVMMFVLYFIPYSLMVGELGSAFKNSGGGVNSWVYDTIGPKVAYYAGWTYWACHITYIASKGSGSLKALSWAVFRNAETYDTFPTIGVQMATLGVFLIGCFIASKGMNPLKKLLSLAGTSMFVMSILYIIMMLAAPAINPGADYVTIDFSLKNLIPNFNIGYFSSLSILVFAVGGCEKISPYVNKVENPSKGFPKGIIAMTAMVLVCAMLGTIAMGRMFDPVVINASEESFNSYAANGSYWAFQKLGEYYAHAIHDKYGDDFDVLFGPAYKGIPLSVVTAIAFSELYGKEIRYCSDRKEEKDHGADKGSFLGSKLKDGDRVVMIEDVTTSGKSMEETVPKVKGAADVEIVGLMVSLDRMEVGKGGVKCALDEVHDLYGFETNAIVTMREVIEHLYNKEYKGKVIIDDTLKAAIDAYYEQYGAK